MQHRRGQVHRGRPEDPALTCAKMDLGKALGYFSSNKGSRGLDQLLQNPLDYFPGVQKSKDFKF